MAYQIIMRGMQIGDAARRRPLACCGLLASTGEPGPHLPGVSLSADVSSSRILAYSAHQAFSNARGGTATLLRPERHSRSIEAVSNNNRRKFMEMALAMRSFNGGAKIW